MKKIYVIVLGMLLFAYASSLFAAHSGKEWKEKMKKRHEQNMQGRAGGAIGNNNEEEKKDDSIPMPGTTGACKQILPYQVPGNNIQNARIAAWDVEWKGHRSKEDWAYVQEFLQQGYDVIYSFNQSFEAGRISPLQLYRNKPNKKKYVGYIELESCHLFQEDELISFLKTYGCKVQNLSLSYTCIGDRVLDAITTCCKELKRLNICGCNGITQKGLLKFLKTDCFKTLEAITVSDYNANVVNDDVLRCIESDNLCIANFSHTTVSWKSIENFILGCKKLAFLDISNCGYGSIFKQKLEADRATISILNEKLCKRKRKFLLRAECIEVDSLESLNMSLGAWTELEKAELMKQAF